MTTPDKKSHWASLANVLGAKVPPEKPAPYTPPTPAAAAPTPETPAPTASVPPPAAHKTPKPKPAAKGKDNWGSVLGMLGLRSAEPESAPEPEAPAAPAPVAERPAPPAPPRETRAPERESRASEPQRESRPSEWEKPFLAAQPLPKNLWELVGDTSPPPPQKPVIDEIHETYAEVGGNDLTLPEDDDNAWGADRPTASPSARGRDEDRPRRDRGGEEGGRPRRRRRRRRSEPGVESIETPSTPIDDYSDEPKYRDEAAYRDEPEFVADDEMPPMVVDRDEEDDFSPPRAPAAEGEEEGRPRRRRRRRGRGRGRGGDREAAPPAAEPVARAGYEDDIDEEDDVELPRAARPAPASRAPAPRNAPPAARGSTGRMRSREVDEVEDDDHEEIDMAEHRGIPTWQEAMAIVVGNNMDARAKNPGGSRGGRGRGGRGRGGRGR